MLDCDNDDNPTKSTTQFQVDGLESRVEAFAALLEGQTVPETSPSKDVHQNSRPFYQLAVSLVWPL